MRVYTRQGFDVGPVLVIGDGSSVEIGTGDVDAAKRLREDGRDTHPAPPNYMVAPADFQRLLERIEAVAGG